MPFVFSKISNHGTVHPVVARLHMQTNELLENTSFSKEAREAIFGSAFELGQRLIRCGEISDLIVEECRKLEAQEVEVQSSNAVFIPHLVGLSGEVESFLYEAKNSIRDATKLLNAIFGSKFKGASDFCDFKERGLSEVAFWLQNRGEHNREFVAFFQHHEPWIERLVQMRNAIEHPGGHSGTLHIKNYELTNNGLMRPTWCLNNEERAYIIEDQIIIRENILCFVEELIVLSVMKHLASPFLELHQIPEGARDPRYPRRFFLSLSEEAMSMISKQANESNNPVAEPQ